MRVLISAMYKSDYNPVYDPEPWASGWEFGSAADARQATAGEPVWLVCPGCDYSISDDWDEIESCAVCDAPPQPAAPPPVTETLDISEMIYRAPLASAASEIRAKP